MKIGIVCDDYKLDKFKEKLSAIKVKFKISPFTKDTSTISLETSEDKVGEIKKVCEEVERSFK